ncbi:MAG: hypothetical protein M1816_007838 [Peltula sp. TS41687]|nr:MAG: hypothetical protein M1816_007838 [Peltula sp. TS41687]
MPGILPMKVIKVGTASQSRIAQACDRCRSKKIRCDGTRPTCSQCASVGFECRTSDKLSRRAFPRGYTESLEERVRNLETEVRELKEQLDQRDEKIEMLQKMRSNSAPSTLAEGQMLKFDALEGGGAAAPVRSHGDDGHGDRDEGKSEVFRVKETPRLLGGDGSDPFFAGFSSIRGLVDDFKRKLQRSKRSDLQINTDHLLAQSRKPFSSPALSPKSRPRSSGPPRLISDQLINIYFQEWAPLFPVLHRPTFLASYETFCVAPDSIKEPRTLTQLYLVFCIAAASGEQSLQKDVHIYEKIWRDALDGLTSDHSITTLQCFILAQMFYLSTGDHERLQSCRSLAVGLSHRLGLHQNQRHFSFGPLESETRKKIFWCLYTLDCFGAAILGLPRLLKDNDIETEYPSDVDDEYITEEGFQPPPAGESTKLSAALALFRASRILSKVLEKMYPPGATSYEISRQDQYGLETELQNWCKSLAPHLTLHFAQGKPAQGIVSSNSPILSLVFHYIRILIYRPAIGSKIDPHSSSSVLTLADCARHIIQILQLLEDRKMSFAFCINRHELLVSSGLCMIFQALDLDQERGMIKDSQRLVSVAIEMMEHDLANAAPELRRIASAVMPTIGASRAMPPPRLASSTPPGRGKLKAAQGRLQSFASKFYRRPEGMLGERGRRSTTPTSFPNMSPTADVGAVARAPPMQQPGGQPIHRIAVQQSMLQRMSPQMGAPMEAPNLDYLPFSTEPLSSDPELSAKLGGHYVDPVSVSMAENPWEQPARVSTKTRPTDSLYRSLTSGSSISTSMTAASMGWTPDMWSPGLQTVTPQPPLLSYSDGSVTSLDDLSPDLNSTAHESYRGMILPSSMGEDGYGLEGFDSHHLGRLR